MIVGGAIADHVSQRPDLPALSFDDCTITWRELEIILQAAAIWLDRHSAPRSAVALNLPNCPAFVILFLAAVRLGREVQVLDTSWPQFICQKTIDLLKPGLIISGTEDFGCENAFHISPAMTFGEAADFFGRPVHFSCWPMVDELTPFYVGFTSGTTGLPKGYRRHHLSWVASFDAAQDEFNVSCDDVILAPGSISHSLFLFAFAYAMHAGAHCVLARHFRPDQVLDLARVNNASVLFGVPAQCGLIARYSETHAIQAVQGLRRLICSGSKWGMEARRTLRQLFPKAQFSEFYGASETSFISVAHEKDDPAPDSVGRPFRDVTISIRDQQGRALPDGEAGQLFVRSKMLFMGYAMGGEAHRTSDDGFVSVDDIGFIDETGQIILCGRSHRMMNTSGKILYPEELEHILEQHGSIQSALVIAVEDIFRGEKPVAIIRLCGAANRAGLASFMRQYLPDYKVPRDFYISENWAFTPSGKTDINALRSELNKGHLEQLA